MAKNEGMEPIGAGHLPLGQARTGGGPQRLIFRRALVRVLLAEEEIESGIKVRKLDKLLTTCYDKVLLYAERAQTLKELKEVLPFLQLVKVAMDGLDLPKASKEAKASKTSNITLVGGKVTREETILSVTEQVEPPESKDDSEDQNPGENA